MSVGQRVQLEQATGTVEAICGTVAEVRWDTGARCSVHIRSLRDAPGCQECGSQMKVERGGRKYCSDTCRKRAHKHRAKGDAKRRGRQGHGEPENAREVAEDNAREALAA